MCSSMPHPDDCWFINAVLLLPIRRNHRYRGLRFDSGHWSAQTLSWYRHRNDGHVCIPLDRFQIAKADIYLLSHVHSPHQSVCRNPRQAQRPARNRSPTKHESFRCHPHTEPYQERPLSNRAVKDRSCEPALRGSPWGTVPGGLPAVQASGCSCCPSSRRSRRRCACRSL